MFINNKKYFNGIIDGKKSKDIHSFLKEIGKAFYFPDYYGNNMNALYECLNDLDWIKEENYILTIENFSDFLSNENNEEKENIMITLKNVAIEWQNVPNYEGEDEFRKKADFLIIKK